MAPAYRQEVAADLDAVLADPALDVSAVARTIAAATVGLSGRELGEFMARLRDTLRADAGGLAWHPGTATAAGVRSPADPGTLFDGL